jgi:hypothetical protein
MRIRAIFVGLIASMALTIVGGTAFGSTHASSHWIDQSAGDNGNYLCEGPVYTKAGDGDVTIQIHSVDGDTGPDLMKAKLVTVNDPGYADGTLIAETDWFTVPQDSDQLVATDVLDGTNFAMCIALGGSSGYQVNGWFYY